MDRCKLDGIIKARTSSVTILSKECNWQFKPERNTWNLDGLGLSISIRSETFSKETKMIIDSKVAVLSVIMKAPFSNGANRSWNTTSLKENRKSEVKLSKKVVNGHSLELSRIFFWKSGKIFTQLSLRKINRKLVFKSVYCKHWNKETVSSCCKKNLQN